MTGRGRDQSAHTTRLSAAMQRDLLHWAREESPREACGLLLGIDRCAAGVEVHELVRARNLAHGTRSFEIDPGDVVRADVEARRRGLALVGSWHSHPTGGAVPSASDLAALWPRHLCVIVSPSATPSVRAWRVIAGELAEIGVSVIPDEACGSRTRSAHGK